MRLFCAGNEAKHNGLFYKCPTNIKHSRSWCDDFHSRLDDDRIRNFVLNQEYWPDKIAGVMVTSKEKRVFSSEVGSGSCYRCRTEAKMNIVLAFHWDNAIYFECCS